MMANPRRIGWLGLVVLAARMPLSADVKDYEFTGTRWEKAPGPAKGTPAGELALVRKLLDDKQPKKALAAAKKYLRKYPNHAGREEVLCLAGQAEMDRGRYYRAWERYEEQIAAFPKGAYLDRALEREYGIADAFLRGRKRVVAKVFRVSADDEAIEMLTRLAEHAPGTPIAERALMRIADHYFEKHKYAEAVDAYDQYLRLYGKSAGADHAVVQAARAARESFRGTDYDETPLIDAEQRFKNAAERMQQPADAERAGVPQQLQAIRSARAQKLYQVAEFYKRVGRDSAADFYYRQVQARYADTRWAELARRAAPPREKESGGAEPSAN